MPSSQPSSHLPAIRAVSAAPAVTAETLASNGALHLRADGVSHAFGSHRVLTDISLVVPAGVPTGLLGENGSGKSTLMRILAGILPADAGTLRVPGPCGFLHQELPFDAATTRIRDVIEDALRHARALEADLAAAGEDLAADASPAAAARFDDLLTRATIADVWNASYRAASVLAGLGLSAVPEKRLLSEISGGQRGRLALAHLLISRPTTLLLDEPTNHLDDAGADFLAATLAEHPGPVLIASHDRAFLDAATRAQLDLDPAPSPHEQEPGGLTAYSGSFTDYLHARLDARERWEKQFRDEQDELKDLARKVKDSHSVGHEGSAPRTEARAAKKFYADRNATVVSRRVRDAQRRLEELEASQIRKPSTELHFTGIPAGAGTRRGSQRGGGRSGGQVLLTVSRAGVTGRLEPVSLTLLAGQKLLITGVNGSGKSTLLALLAGTLEPTTGTVSTTPDHRLLAQDEDVDEELTVRQLLTGADGAGTADGTRAAGVPRAADAAHATNGADGTGRGAPDLMGLVHPRDLDRPLGELSRGQQRRAALTVILRQPPELLLLDEPTNHLSLDLATRLERAVQQWEGTVVIASHDRWLRQRWRGETLRLPG